MTVKCTGKEILLAGTVPKLLVYVPNLSYALTSCTWLLNLILFYRWTHQDDIKSPGHTKILLTWTYLDGLYSHGSLVWRTHLQALDPPRMYTPGYTWNGHTWMTFTHMDGIKSLDTPGKFGHTWKHWTLEPWNLLWILPDNPYGFFQTTPLDLHDPWTNC